MTIQELLNSYNKQVQYMQNQLLNGDIKGLVENAELFATWIKVKVKELNEKGEE